jgi:hypothetical protein
MTFLFTFNYYLKKYQNYFLFKLINYLVSLLIISMSKINKKTLVLFSNNINWLIKIFFSL